MGPYVLCFLFLSVILFLMEEKQDVDNTKHTNNYKSAVCVIAPPPRPLTEYEMDKYK